MTRQVYPRDMVAHLWANASQDSARDPSGNFYYNGPALYSYGSHHVIAYRMENTNGSVSYLWNADTYSVTTARHHAVAWRAIPGYRNLYRIAGLCCDTFRGQAWRAKLIRDALSQAGAAYERAAKITRKSGKRDAAVTTASERIRVAEYIARNTLETKGTHVDDRKTARAALRCIGQVTVWDADADNAVQRANATQNAALLVRDEMRAKMRGKIAAGLREIAIAQDVAPCIGNDNERARYRQRCARDAVRLFTDARDIAKRYKFKMPRVPDADAIAAELAPKARLETLQECAYHARQALQNSESSFRLYSRARSNDWHLSSARHYAEQVLKISRHVDEEISPETVPQWMRERANTIVAKYARCDAIMRAAHGAQRIAGKVESGDSYANAGHARDALREYHGAINAARSIHEHLPDTHPARRYLPDESTLARMENYIHDADARIAAENAERIAAWRSGASVRMEHDRDAGAMLRLVKGKIETSWGADVPVSVAPIVWKAANACRDAGTAHEFDSNTAPRLGHFKMDKIDADGSIHVGCHFIRYQELEYIAARLGYSAT